MSDQTPVAVSAVGLRFDRHRQLHVTNKVLRNPDEQRFELSLRKLRRHRMFHAPEPVWPGGLLATAVWLISVTRARQGTVGTMSD